MIKNRIKNSDNFFLKIPKWIWFIIAGLATIVSLLSFFYPKISVSPTTSLDPQNALSAPFKIINEGHLPIYNLQYRICPYDETMPKPGIRVWEGPVWDLTEHRIAKLGAGESWTIMLPLQYRHKELNKVVTKFIDVRMFIEFELKFIPKKFKYWFHFNTAKTAEGKLNWYSQPFINKTSINPRLNQNLEL